MATKLIFLLFLLFSSFSIIILGSSDTFYSVEAVVEDPYTGVYGHFAAFAPYEKTLDTFTILPTPALGPESLAFSSSGEGPFTGVSDGRILQYQGPHIGFLDFAYASPNRTKAMCDGTTELEMGPKCGRPLGIGFNHRTNELYIADAYYGLCKVGPKGGLAKQLATIAEGLPLKWTDAIDVDQITEIVYFTDVSSKYSMMEMVELLAAGDSPEGCSPTIQRRRR